MDRMISPEQSQDIAVESDVTMVRPTDEDIVKEIDSDFIFWDELTQYYGEKFF